MTFDGGQYAFPHPEDGVDAEQWSLGRRTLTLRRSHAALTSGRIHRVPFVHSTFYALVSSCAGLHLAAARPLFGISVASGTVKVGARGKTARLFASCSLWAVNSRCATLSFHVSKCVVKYTVMSLRFFVLGAGFAKNVRERERERRDDPSEIAC